MITRITEPYTVSDPEVVVGGICDELAGAADELAGAADELAGAADELAGAADELAKDLSSTLFILKACLPVKSKKVTNTRGNTIFILSFYFL